MDNGNFKLSYINIFHVQQRNQHAFLKMLYRSTFFSKLVYPDLIHHKKLWFISLTMKGGNAYWLCNWHTVKISPNIYVQINRFSHFCGLNDQNFGAAQNLNLKKKIFYQQSYCPLSLSLSLAVCMCLSVCLSVSAYKIK